MNLTELTIAKAFVALNPNEVSEEAKWLMLKAGFQQSTEMLGGNWWSMRKFDLVRHHLLGLGTHIRTCKDNERYKERLQGF